MNHGHYQCAGARERSCPLQAWRGSGRLAERGGVPREPSQQRGSPGLALGSHWPGGGWWGWKGDGLGGLGQGAGDSGPQEVGTEEAKRCLVWGAGDHQPGPGRLMGCRGARRALWRKWGRLAGWKGGADGEQGVRGGRGAVPSPGVLEQREELRWHFRAASLAGGVGWGECRAGAGREGGAPHTGLHGILRGCPRKHLAPGEAP